MYALDSLALACVAAGSAGWDQMATCSGRNLAYRKEVYHQVGGFARIARFISGDDDLFLHLIQQETRWQIRYALDPGALIPAFSPENLSTFFHQRIRHASKGRHYGLKMTSMLAAVYLFNLFLFITIPAAIFGLGNALPLAILLLKCLFEFILLARMAEICAKIDLLRIFLLAELIHIPYVVAFGALGQFSKFRWKKSKHTARMPVKKITEAK